MGIADKIKEVFHQDSSKTSSSATPNTHSNTHSDTHHPETHSDMTTHTPHSDMSTHTPHVDSERDESRAFENDRATGEERDTVDSELPGSSTTHSHAALHSDVLGSGVHNGVTGVGSERPLDRHDSTLNRDRTDYEPVNPLPHNEVGGPIRGSEDPASAGFGSEEPSEFVGENQEFGREGAMAGRD